MKSTVRYPSDQFPGFPPVSLSIPEGWQPISSPAVLVAAGAEPNEGEFLRNVVVTAARFSAGFSLESAAELVIGKFSALPELVELSRRKGPVLGHPGVRYEASHLDENLGALVQIVHFTVIERGDVATSFRSRQRARGSNRSRFFLNYARLWRALPPPLR